MKLLLYLSNSNLCVISHVIDAKWPGWGKRVRFHWGEVLSPYSTNMAIRCTLPQPHLFVTLPCSNTNMDMHRIANKTKTAESTTKNVRKHQIRLRMQDSPTWSTRNCDAWAYLLMEKGQHWQCWHIRAMGCANRDVRDRKSTDHLWTSWERGRWGKGLLYNENKLLNAEIGCLKAETKKIGKLTRRVEEKVGITM